uniref:Putative secreted protein n=1 Tax=Anopheles darlingi TaxID=43151 RepID=A0A2M4DMY5_ANODA
MFWFEQNIIYLPLLLCTSACSRGTPQTTLPAVVDRPASTIQSSPWVIVHHHHNSHPAAISLSPGGWYDCR